jgi:xanthine dehydrogenase accessory factor
MREILAATAAALAEGRSGVFCAVVETRGSTPQKAGAALLAFAEGGQVGTLGGGCVEAEARQRALRLLDTGRPELLSFLLDDNYGWDDGLICGGRMVILAQPLAAGLPTEAPERRYFRTFHQRAAAGLGCMEAVLTQPVEGVPEGARYLFDGQGQLLAALPEQPPPAAVRGNLPDLATRPRPRSAHGIAYLPVLPRIRLLIVGGGHVGQAVGQLAADADFDVWVVDDRAAYASAERFPKAQRRIVGEIGPTLQALKAEAVTPDTYCVIVTRGHAHDEEALFHLAATPAGYVGMIGSKRKIRLILDDLRAKGIAEAALARVFAPLGLAIGSQTVPEIAVSIVAELIAFRNLGGVPAAMRTPAAP